MRAKIQLLPKSAKCFNLILPKSAKCFYLFLPKSAKCCMGSHECYLIFPHHLLGICHFAISRILYTFVADGNYSAPPMGMSNRLTVVLQQELH